MTRTLRPGRAWTVLLAIGGLALGGCASAPRTTVVLLPDEDGHVGAVVVSDRAGSQWLDQAFHAVTIARADAPPSGGGARGEPEVSLAYRDLLKAQPAKPVAFTLHFILDTATLTEESKAAIPEMIQAARSRKPTEITVYGHADASGTERRNLELSAQRAQVVADLLRHSDPAFDRIEVQYFGSRAPVVPNEGNKPEPRNRRAEVVIL